MNTPMLTVGEVIWVLWLASLTVTVGLAVTAINRWGKSLPTRMVIYTSAAVIVARLAYRIERFALTLANEARRDVPTSRYRAMRRGRLAQATMTKRPEARAAMGLPVLDHAMDPRD